MSIKRVVTTQDELDAALAAPDVAWIEIRSENEVRLDLPATGSATVRATDSATVRAYGSATVTAYDSATVTATGSATVTAYGSATVRAYGLATVTATAKVAIHLHSRSCRINGGVVINHVDADVTARAWCDYHGVTVINHDQHGPVALVYKAVSDDWTGGNGYGVTYEPGSTPEAHDWSDTDQCGHGLHFWPTATHAQAYNGDAVRYLRVGVRLDEMRPIAGATAKCKARRVVVPCVEVDVHHREIKPEVPA